MTDPESIRVLNEAFRQERREARYRALLEAAELCRVIASELQGNGTSSSERYGALECWDRLKTLADEAAKDTTPDAAGPCQECSDGKHVDCTHRVMEGGCCDGVDPCL